MPAEIVERARRALARVGPRGISGDPQIVRIGDVWVMLAYPLTEERFRRLVGELAARRAAAPQAEVSAT